MKLDDKPNLPKQANPASGRRTFVRGFASAGAVLSTVTARSAWATSCVSGNLSNHGSAETVECEQAQFSPGGWKPNGNGGAAQLWQYTGFEPGSMLSSLLPAYNGASHPGNSKHDLPSDATILDALESNIDYEKHAASAALNAAVWDAVMDDCEIPESSACTDILKHVPNAFYFPYSLGDIQTMYANGDSSILGFIAYETL